MTRLTGTSLILAAGLALPGCVTHYTVVSAIPRADITTTVYADDEDQGAELAAWLGERGYDVDDAEVTSSPEKQATITWGGAPLSYVEEISAWVQGRFDVELERRHEYEPDDYSVTVNLPDRASSRTDRAGLRVVVFTDDETKGSRLLDSLRALGYTNDANYVTGEPNDDFNVKWGAAPEELVDEITGLVSGLFEVELDRQHSFEPDDHDLFINLPFEGAERDRADFEVTVFCGDEAVANNLLKRLAALGYTNAGNEVLSGPNGDFNVKYGALPPEMVAEIAELVEQQFAAEVRRSPEFDSGSIRVFINIPETK